MDPSSTDPAPTPRVHLVPDTPSVTDAIAASSTNTFFWLQQPLVDSSSTTAAGAAAADTVLRGFNLAGSGKADAEGLLPVMPAWQVVLPGQLLALASRDPTEPVHSYVKVGACVLCHGGSNCMDSLSGHLCSCSVIVADELPHVHEGRLVGMCQCQCALSASRQSWSVSMECVNGGCQRLPNHMYRLEHQHMYCRVYCCCRFSGTAA
jgi:hypothetical protein